MEFNPQAHDEIVLEDQRYTFAEHPSAPSTPFGAEGRTAFIYKLNGAWKNGALKVFKEHFRRPSLIGTAEKLADFAHIPGLAVCRRTVLRPDQLDTALQAVEELHYAMLMPWIEGPTWFDILLEKRALNDSACLSLARALCTTLLQMETHALAHCDLSAGNLVLPALHSGGMNGSAPVELVDVEGMFGPGLQRPEVLTSGSYPHRASAREGEWHVHADRFAGAVLISEFLAWADPQVRDYVKRTGRDTYFETQELQKEGEGFRLMRSALCERWGGSVDLLFARAWESKHLLECPSFAEWQTALQQLGTQPALVMQTTESPAAQAVTVLLDLAAQLNQQGNRPAALTTYRQALSMVEIGSPLHTAISLLMKNVESTPPAPSLMAPPAQQAQPARPEVIAGPADLPAGEWNPHLPGSPSRASELWRLVAVFALVAVVMGVGAVFLADTSMNAFNSQLTGSLITAVLIGAVQTWLFRLRLRPAYRLWFCLAAAVGGLVAGALGGHLYANFLVRSSWLGAIIGLVAGAVTALGQNLMMRGGSKPALQWFCWNALSWAVIWLAGWTASWGASHGLLSGEASTAAGIIVILLLTGISLSLFLRSVPEIEF